MVRQAISSRLPGWQRSEPQQCGRTKRMQHAPQIELSLGWVFSQATGAVQGVCVILIVCSVVCWAVILEKAVLFRRYRRQAAGFEQWVRSGRLAGVTPLGDELSDALLAEGRAVWGSMHSLVDIAQANDTRLAVVAPGIAESLFTTAAGLVAAARGRRLGRRCPLAAFHRFAAVGRRPGHPAGSGLFAQARIPHAGQTPRPEGPASRAPARGQGRQGGAVGPARRPAQRGRSAPPATSGAAPDSDRGVLIPARVVAAASTGWSGGHRPSAFRVRPQPGFFCSGSFRQRLPA